VVEARGGNDALAAVERGADFDVLVSDLVMPDVSGAELVSRIRASGRDPAILLVSGYTEDVYIRGGALPPGASFMPKPFSAAALAEKLREVVRAHGLV
jgi:CheY-like chemotaxis protein